MSFGFDGNHGTDVRPVHKPALKLWAKDESAPGANDGTRVTASWVNRVVGQFRQLAIRASLSLSEDGDDDLADAIEAFVAVATASFAPLTSPSFAGVPTAPTASLGTNTTQIATMAALQAAIANLISSAPGALDTLDELAAALGDDANFAATITTVLALKAPLASPTLTGTPAAPTAAGGTNTTQIATTAFVAAAIAALTILSLASQAEAEAGSDNTKANSPLRTEQQIVGKARTFAQPQRATRTAITHNTAWDAATISAPKVTVNGSNFTIANPTGQINEQRYSILVEYTTAHSLVWDTLYKGLSGITPTATAGATDHFLFESNGTNLRCIGYRLNVGA